MWGKILTLNHWTLSFLMCTKSKPTFLTKRRQSKNIAWSYLLPKHSNIFFISEEKSPSSPLAPRFFSMSTSSKSTSPSVWKNETALHVRCSGVATVRSGVAKNVSRKFQHISTINLARHIFKDYEKMWFLPEKPSSLRLNWWHTLAP